MMGRQFINLSSKGIFIQLVVVGVVAVSINAQDPDRIQRKDGPPIKAQVIYDGFDKVIYKKAGRKQKNIASQKVINISYTGFPKEYGQGLAAEQKAGKGAGNSATLYETASKSFFLTANSDGLREPLKAIAFFNGAQCMRKLGLIQKARMAQAADKFDSFTKQFPKSRYVMSAMLYSGICKRLAGDYTGALSSLSVLEKLVIDNTLPQIWEAKAKIETIKIYLDSGKSADARTVCQSAGHSLDGITPRTSEIELMSLRVEGLEGEAQIIDKDYGNAISYFDRMVKKDKKDATRLVIALLGRGFAHLTKGMAGKDVKELRLAQFDLAKAYVADKYNGEEAARALYLISECLRALGPNQVGKDINRVVKDYLKQIVRYYADTEWAMRAHEKL